MPFNQSEQNKMGEMEGEARVVKIGVVEGEGRIELVDWEGRSVGDEGDGDVVEVRGGRVVGDEGDEGDEVVVVLSNGVVVVVVVSKGVEGGRAVPVGRDGRSVGVDRG